LASAEENTIGWLFKEEIRDKTPVKVCVKDITNQSGQAKIATDAFKAMLEKSFHERRSIKFETVNSPAESKIQVSAVIKNYQYMEKGPLKPSIGVETTLLDAAATMTENYVEMSVDYTVTDTKTDKVLWQGNVNEYLKQKMTSEESIPLISDILARTFIWRCFGKANLRESNNHELP